jgi:DNA-binding NtrC family response regulator
MSLPGILVVDDDPHARGLLRRLLGPLGQVSEASSAPAAEELLKGTVPVDVVLTDMAMPDPDDGLRVLRAALAKNPDTPVVVLTAFGNIEGALDTIQKGAFDYLAKPFDVDAIVRVVRRALEQRRLVEENKSLRARVKPQELVGRSQAILEVYKQVARAAATNVPVLITGETGTGKEQVARSLHQRSPRSAGRFVAVDCGAIAESLMESELFGHARGAFTGASGARRGLFEEATGGTLFLDEIGDMPLPMQAKLLRVLEEGEVERIGGDKTTAVDVRVLVATHRNLEELVKEGKFRQDLLHRVYVFPITLPPLRERREDIPALIEHFARQVAGQNNWKPTAFSSEAIEALQQYAWPGNVRELRNVVERLLLLAVGDHLDRTAVEMAIPDLQKRAPIAAVADGSGPLSDRVSDFEKGTILAELKSHSYNMTNTAKALGLERSHLYKKCQQLGINLPEVRKES